MNKKEKGQFYTVNTDYILENLIIPESVENIVEPFAGCGDLIKWIQKNYKQKFNFECYDIDPKQDYIKRKDTLHNPPNYDNKFVITNPPYLAKNKCNNEQIRILFETYNTNDLYKCFMNSLSESECIGGILIIPIGFFLSPRTMDFVCRSKFMSKFKITKVNYFEEDVFPDTPTTVVAFSFEKSNINLTEQLIPWKIYPSKQEKIFHFKEENNWIIGGDIYNLKSQIQKSNSIKIKRYLENMELESNEQLSNLTLNALDSGKENGRICLKYDKDFIYKGKETSRSYATLIFKNIKLSEEEQIQLATKFNKFIEDKRNETYSMFLPAFRESKEYARKRIPFDLAYNIVMYLL